jgi:hypothetical protein
MIKPHVNYTGIARLALGVAMLLAAVVSTAPLAPAGAGVLLDLAGSAWTFPSAIAKVKARAQGLGSTKAVGVEELELRLLPGETWEADLGDALVLRGTYSLESAKRLSLTFDAASLLALAERYEQEVEAAAASEGVSVAVTLTVAASKVIVVVKPRASSGTARAKLSAKFVLEGLVSAPLLGVSGVPGEVAAKLKGISDPVPLIEITG